VSDDAGSAQTVAASPKAGSDRVKLRVLTDSAPRPSAKLWPPGTQVGRYVLAERLGAGGMGVVYRARDPRLDRDVAVKLVSASVDVDAAQERLEREAQAMAKLHHGNVVAVHDIGTHDGQLFIAMELCASSLGAWLKEERPWREVVARFIAAGRGLAAAHAIGLVHRDFKPDNVLLAHDGTVKVSDFGLVVSVVAGDGTPHGVEGTPAYMAPEQLAGEDVDARADQFAFAVSLWEGVCGGRPFQPVSTEDEVTGLLSVIRSRRRMRATSSQVPLRVIKILERALEPEPANRWPSLEAMLAALERATRSRRRWLAIGGAMAAAAIASGVIVALTRTPGPELETINRQVARALPPLWSAAAKLEPDPLRSAKLYLEAYRLGGGTPPLFEAAVRSFDGGDCRATLQAIETLRTEVEGGGYYTPQMKDTVVDLRGACALPYRQTTDVAALEKLADRYFFEQDLDGAVQALMRARQLTTVDGDAARYMLRIGDYARRLGKCDIARTAYKQYLAEEPRSAGDPQWVQALTERGATCEADVEKRRREEGGE